MVFVKDLTGRWCMLVWAMSVYHTMSVYDASSLPQEEQQGPRLVAQPLDHITPPALIMLAQL